MKELFFLVFGFCLLRRHTASQSITADTHIYLQQTRVHIQIGNGFGED